MKMVETDWTGHGRTPSQQCDHIWLNFATLANFKSRYQFLMLNLEISKSLNLLRQKIAIGQIFIVLNS